MNTLLKSAWGLLKEAASVSFTLFKITVPVIILVKILQELGLVDYIGIALKPVMSLVGLPGIMGMAWATALVTNLYGGLLACATLTSQYPLTVAQATVLSTMMLMAHAIPAECRIAQKAGVRFLTIAVIRIASALVYGMILNLVFTKMQWFQQPAVQTWKASNVKETWPQWGLSQLINLFQIFLIILALLLLLKVLKRIRVTELIEACLKPLLAPIGIGKEALNITTIGMVLGLSYGGGLIINDVKKGEIKPRDAFFSLVMMGICHSLIEDTLTAMTLGGTIFGGLVGRVIFTFIVMFIISQIVKRFSDDTFRRYCYVNKKETLL